MINITEYIESGILELYVMGAASPEEIQEVEALAAQYPEIRSEIDAISTAMEGYAMAHAVTPPPTAKFLMLATIDYMERLRKGEQPVSPPELTSASRKEDYATWLDRPDLQGPEQIEGIYIKLIGANPQATTAIVWLQEMAPTEFHHDEHERFLIIEGTCDITVGEEINSLAPGDFFAIPLHQPHSVKVTSAQPCKVILQRIAVAA